MLLILMTELFSIPVRFAPEAGASRPRLMPALASPVSPPALLLTHGIRMLPARRCGAHPAAGQPMHLYPSRGIHHLACLLADPL